MAYRQYRSKDLKNPKVDPFEGVDHAGIAIRVNSNNPLIHVGFLYKTDGATARICHLKTHMDLADEEAGGGFSWLQIALHPTLKRLAVAACQSVILQNGKNIPFGFNLRGPAFVPSTGALTPQPIGYGQTCATFILEIFRMIAVELIDHQNWPMRPEDIATQRGIAMAIGQQNQMVGQAIFANAADKRVRPEEVAASVTIDPTPCKFADVVPIAQKNSC